jgi:hypothetical protein
MIAWIGLPGWDGQDKTVRTGLPGQRCQDKISKKALLV